MNFNLTAAPLFVTGSVGAYPRSSFGGTTPPAPGQPPASSPVSTASVSGLGVVVFTGLEPETQYFAGAQVSGEWRWIGFKTASAASASEVANGVAGSFDVTAFGADSTGATDTVAAEQAAINAASVAGGTVIYPPGTYKRTGAPPVVPVNLAARIRIRGSGQGVTTFNLVEGALRCFDFANGSVGDTLGNCELSDFTVNGNGLTSASGDHVVIGTLKAGALTERVNIRHCYVRRISTVNIPIQAGAVNGRRNVLLSVWHKENGLSRNEITDVVVEDLDLEGGNYGVAVMAQAPSGHSANVFQDAIAIRRIRHVRPVPTAFAASAHVQVGGVGWGRRAIVEDVYGFGSGDVGIELDNLTAISASRCLVEEAWNEAYLLTNFGASAGDEPVTSSLAAARAAGAGPLSMKLVDAVAGALTPGDTLLLAGSSTTAELVTVESVASPTEITVSTVANAHALGEQVQRVGNLGKQRISLTDCRARRLLAAQGEGFVVQNANNVVPIGEIALRDCTWYRRTPDFGSEGGEALKCQVGVTGAPRALRVNGFTALVEGVAYVGAATKIAKLVSLTAQLGGAEMELDLVDVDLSYQGTYVSGGGGVETQLLFTARLAAALTARNIRVRAALTSSNKKLQRLVYLQATNTGALHGLVDGLTIGSSANDAVIRGLQTGNLPGFSGPLVVSSYDTAGLPGESVPTVFGAEASARVTLLLLGEGGAGGGVSARANVTLGTGMANFTVPTTVRSESGGAVCRLEGNPKSTSERAAGATLLTVPEGFRPLHSIAFWGDANGSVVLCQVSTAGALTCAAALGSGQILTIPEGVTWGLT